MDFSARVTVVESFASPIQAEPRILAVFQVLLYFMWILKDTIKSQLFLSKVSGKGMGSQVVLPTLFLDLVQSPPFHSATAPFSMTTTDLPRNSSKYGTLGRGPPDTDIVR